MLLSSNIEESAMMKILRICVMVLSLIFVTCPVYAQEDLPFSEEDIPVPKAGTEIFKGVPMYPADATLQEKAVILASKTDAMNMLCGKDTQLAIAYVRRFGEEGMDIKELKRLENSGIAALEERVKMVVEDQTSCKDSNFLLERFRIMRELRSVSYLLIGVDPKSIPSAGDFSNMEELLSPKDAVEK